MAPRHQGAFYSIASGIALALVVVFWQRSETHLLVLQGPLLWVARAVSILAVAGFIASAHSLHGFDPLGLGPIRAHLGGKVEQASEFRVRGPYRWVRHPLYFFILVLFWSHPDITADRLLFNILWTGWIWVGAVLEERDLTAHFGEKYREYSSRVPMLIPWRGLAS